MVKFCLDRPIEKIEVILNINRTNEGLTLVEIVVVVAIIAIIASISIPSLLSYKKSANETRAVSALRTINSAEELYNTRFSSYGTLSQLANRNIIDATMGMADVTPKQGYIYAMTMGAFAKSWCCQCVPLTWGTSGDKGFLIDNTGQIWEKFESSSWIPKR